MRRSATGPDVRAAELIAQAREERLATIDAEAADTQARVEELERQYMERVQAEDAGEVAPPSAPSGAPVVVTPRPYPRRTSAINLANRELASRWMNRRPVNHHQARETLPQCATFKRQIDI